MSSNPMVQVVLIPVSSTTGAPTGGSLTLALKGDGTYAPATGGQGGWQIIDRPRQVAATQWYDRSPMSIVADLLIDSQTIYGAPGYSVEYECLLLDGWQDKILGTNQPPVFAITGPVAGVQRQWCIYSLSYGAAIRNPQAGFRTQQDVNLTLYEYNSPLQSTLNNPSPAAQATYTATQQSNGAGGYFLYTVSTGDTLETIAAKLLNNYAEWQSIATLNNLRDPNNLYPGQVLLIPNS